MGWGGRAGLVLELLPLPLQGLSSLGKLSGVQVGDTGILTAHWLSGFTLGPSAAGGLGCGMVL